MAENKDEKKAPSKELVPKGDDFFTAVKAAETAKPADDQKT